MCVCVCKYRQVCKTSCFGFISSLPHLTAHSFGCAVPFWPLVLRVEAAPNSGAGNVGLTMDTVRRGGNEPVAYSQAALSR